MEVNQDVGSYISKQQSLYPLGLQRIGRSNFAFTADGLVAARTSVVHRKRPSLLFSVDNRCHFRVHVVRVAQFNSGTYVHCNDDNIAELSFGGFADVMNCS